MFGVVIIIFIIAICAIMFKVAKFRARRKNLMNKYGDTEVVEKIIKKVIWQGMTVDQVIDALGMPENKSETVTNTKKTHVLMYGKTGKNRYLTRITVTNGVVTAWNKK